MKNDDTFRSFLSMGAQIAEEVRRRLDEAAASVGNSSNSAADLDISAITEAILADIRTEINTEVERAITRIGVAREDELASLRARIEKLEK
jgi:vacuolar-type H+-ATPase subunit F/Vma7